MKRLLVMATVLVLLALMVSSVSARATPILFGNGAASGTEHVVIDPPTFPDSASDGEDLPTEEVSVNGGTIITIIVTSAKRAVTVEDTDVAGGAGSKPN